MSKSNPNCGCSPDGPMARWRKQDGCNVFMGIASYKKYMNEMIKLDDPSDTLRNDPNDPDGSSYSGHVMDVWEFMSECMHYDDPSSDFKEDMGVKCIGGILHDYSNKPTFTKNDNIMRKEQERNDMDGKGPDNGGDLVRYPFYDQALVLPPYSRNPPPLVRADDNVWVAATHGHESCGRIKERFWVHVVSVTASGIVTGRSLATLHNFNIKMYDWVHFPITCVIDAEHGKHWSKNNNNEKEKAWKERANAGWNFRHGRDEIEEEMNESMDKLNDELFKSMLGSV